MTALPDLAGSGLRVLGTCDGSRADGLPRDGRIVLFGPDEPGFWSLFKGSPESRDGLPHPLDRWSRRVIGALAEACGGDAIFPFGGPPFLPFQTFATRSGLCWPSPIRFLVHAKVGLWLSFRGALLLDGAAAPVTASRPCDTCAAPCTTACPVDAFTDGYDVAACKAHINGRDGADCLSHGCRARRACPVGANLRLPAQAAFHMEAFR